LVVFGVSVVTTDNCDAVEDLLIKSSLFLLFSSTDFGVVAAADVVANFRDPVEDLRLGFIFLPVSGIETSSSAGRLTPFVIMSARRSGVAIV
jgi:hypothetical protein